MLSLSFYSRIIQAGFSKRTYHLPESTQMQGRSFDMPFGPELTVEGPGINQLFLPWAFSFVKKNCFFPSRRFIAIDTFSPAS